MAEKPVNRILNGYQTEHEISAQSFLSLERQKLNFHCSCPCHSHEFHPSISLIDLEEYYAVNILEQLKHGIARFELVSSPVPSISTSKSFTRFPPLFEDKTHKFFARIGPSLSGGSPAIKKVEHYSVQKITGDGRCLFRALVKGMAFNKGISLNPREERNDADDLRMAVKEVICDSNKERQQFEEALTAITVDESLKRYCQRILRPDFWGGESELLVLSKLCNQPVIVYIPEHEHTRGGWGSGFIPIAEYGTEFLKGRKEGKPRKVVRLLYSGKNHYDLLV